MKGVFMRTRMLTAIFYFIFFFLIGSTQYSLQAQDKHGPIGVGIPISTLSPTINVKIWASDFVAVEPSLGFKYINVSGTEGTSVIFSTIVDFQWGADQFKKYVGVGGLVNHLSTGPGYTDGAIQTVLGFEYFVLTPLSVGGEMQLSCYFADKNFSPTGLSPGETLLQTSEVALVRFYF